MVDFSLWDIFRNLLLAARWTVGLSLIAFVGGGLVGLALLLALKDKIAGKDFFAEAEDVLTGPGLLSLYKAVAENPVHVTPEAVLQAALAGADAAAEKTLDHFMTFLARASGDVGMALQARGGVYLAGGIAPSIAAKLQQPKYRAVFEDKGRIAEVMKPIPWFVITDRFPAFKGCAAALAAMGE